MFRHLILIFVTITGIASAFAQQTYIDSLLKQARVTESDTLKLVFYRNAARIYAEINPDSAFHYAEKALQLTRQMQFRLDESSALREMGYALLNKGNYPRSLQTLLSAMEILENPKSEQRVLHGSFPYDDELFNRNADPHIQRISEMAFTYQILGILYANSNKYEKALEYHLMAKQKADEAGNIPLQSIISMTSGRVYLGLKKADSALISLQQADKLAMQSGYVRYTGSIYLNTGRVYLAMNQPDDAMNYFRLALESSRDLYYYRGVAACNLAIADLHKQQGRRDSTLFYLRHALQAANDLAAPDLFVRSYTALAAYYKSAGNNDSAVKYQSLIIQINDSIFNSRQVQQFQNIDFDEQQRLQQIEEARAAYREKLRLNLLLGGLGLFLIIALLFWRNSLQRKRANIILSKQKAELETTLTTLKATQKQLVQAEKMASLGELTAGIAHEIQNPLNFVNNFSEINKELISELVHEVDKGNTNEVKLIAADIRENSDKINHHGKRADSIVKGMLQHSRISSGQKELTDINALCNEYLLLAYHGLRTRDKSFHATMKTDFDPGAGQINIVPQDIGRVILNLVNNALYACGEQFRIMSSPQKSEHDQSVSSYEPEVMLSTKKQNDRLEIKVTDNGCGIPQEILDKIFQPFFTTKPAGKGTGLGLSISYDIIRAHGGEMKVETNTGRGSVFTVLLDY